MEPKRVKFLVVDSGAFIKNSPVHEYAEHIYTVDGAIKEIKDKATKERLQFLPYTLLVKQPTPESLKYVSEFSKRTGDYSNLSAVDLKIIALTYELEKEHVGVSHLNKDPSCQVTGQPAKVDSNLVGFYYPKDDISCPQSSEEDEEEGFQSAHSDLSSDYESASDGEDEDLDSDSWITPSNISEVQKKMSSLGLEQTSSTVACVTTDFSIQNVLLQIGLNVISVNGMIIKQAKVFILRCYGCYKTTNDNTKKFCPNCGNKTLKRVAVTVNDDGTKSIHINFRRPINIRGKRFSLPTPKGGKHSYNPIVCEDQPVPHNRLPKAYLQKTNALQEDYVAQKSPFAVNDVYSRAVHLGIHVRHRHFDKKNPNASSKRTGNKKRS